MDVILLAVGAVGLVSGALFRHLQRWSVSPALLGLVTERSSARGPSGWLPCPPTRPFTS